jgi:hypothetical protein
MSDAVIILAPAVLWLAVFFIPYRFILWATKRVGS